MPTAGPHGPRCNRPEGRAAPFHVKDPHDPADFDWLALCDYQDYGTTPYELTGPLLNDFADWPELSGWSSATPSAATELPTRTEVAAYPVTFIRWWGATAFADNYAAYDEASVTDPLIENGSTLRSWRGGPWNYHQATLETAGRYHDEEDRGNDHFGFRGPIDHSPLRSPPSVMGGPR